MENKIPFQNRILAFILSFLIVIPLLISFFTFPIELVLLNSQSFKPVLEIKENLSRYPGIIANVLTSELISEIPSSQFPKILSNTEGLKKVLEKHIPSEWASSIFNDLTNHVIDYLNFRIPDSSSMLEISQLKTTLILKSDAIGLDYISTLPRCSETSTNKDIYASKTVLDVFQLPPCKPDGKSLQAVSDTTAIYFEDLINRLPATVSISGVLPYDKNKADNYFYYYSLGRWALRMLPIIAISLLIVISLLLRPEKDVMLRWVGRLLIFISGFSLIGLVILMIGFDQFVVLLINRYLKNLVDGFGILLLGLIQKVGYLSLVWVLISVITVLAFGLFLLLISKLFKPKPVNSNLSQNDEERNLGKDELLPESIYVENLTEKVIKPETLEEIEGQEKKALKKKKPNTPNP
jgi:hypothetical protein